MMQSNKPGTNPAPNRRQVLGLIGAGAAMLGATTDSARAHEDWVKISSK